MSQTQRRLWLDEAVDEIRQWPRRRLLTWSLCTLVALLLWLLAIVANRTVAQDWNSAAGSIGAGTSESVNAAGKAGVANSPEQLVLLDTPSPQPAPDSGELRRISEAALTLHTRLQQTAEPAASHASKAGRVAGLAVAMRQDQLTNSNDSFWQPMSEAIADLEQAVRLGDVADAASTGLITELRSRYAQLRAQQNLLAGPATEAVNETSVASSETQTDASAQSRSVIDAPLPWSLRALPWLTFLLPLGCFVYAFVALRDRLSERHRQSPKAGYARVASASQAAQMTSPAVQSNRNAAERRTQAAILQLLDEMEPLAEGDLTHEASVTEDLTGALADAFNQAVHELRRLVKQINRSTDQVRTAVSESRARTFSMAKQGAVQAREVTRTYDRLEQMQADVRSLSETTQQVASYAQQMAVRTQHAAKAVASSNDALAAMRKQSNGAMQSIQRLVNSTQGIESRLADVKAASSRTDLLALNSTIQAASRNLDPELSGHSNFGDETLNHSAQNFAELATDVSALASLLGDATSDIDQLSEVIRDEAAESLQAMQATVLQVEATEQSSQEARNHLDEIATAALALEKAVSQIASRTSVQSQGVTEVAETTRVINDITHDTANALKQAVADLQQLENLSNSLEASVHGFRLPQDASL